MTTSRLLLRGGTLRDGRVRDVLVSDGTVSSVGTSLADGDRDGDIDGGGIDGGGTASGGPSGATVEIVDISGFLLLPAPADPHAHLDKALTAHLVSNPSGSLDGAVDAWLPFRAAQRAEDIAFRARRAARMALASGATTVRSHVDIGDGIELRGLDALVQVRDELAGEMHLQLVAFTSAPLTGREGSKNRAVLREALRRGADVVGACPHRQPDPNGSQRVCLEIAAEFELPVDLHTDETLETEPLTLPVLAELVLDAGFSHGVVASHCVSLGMTPPSVTRRVAAQLAHAGISVVCCPATNLYLQGRDHPRATPRGLTAVHELRAAGVTVAGGGDNVQDPFNAVGRGDPLDTAALLVLAAHLTPEEAYDAVSNRARAAMGLPTVDLQPGSPAELLAIRAQSVAEAVAVGSPERLVIHQGRIVARSTFSREFPVADQATAAHDTQPSRGWLRRGLTRNGTAGTTRPAAADTSHDEGSPV